MCQLGMDLRALGRMGGRRPASLGRAIVDVHIWRNSVCIYAVFCDFLSRCDVNCATSAQNAIDISVADPYADPVGSAQKSA